MLFSDIKYHLKGITNWKHAYQRKVESTVLITRYLNYFYKFLEMLLYTNPTELLNGLGSRTLFRKTPDITGWDQKSSWNLKKFQQIIDLSLQMKSIWASYSLLLTLSWIPFYAIYSLSSILFLIVFFKEF
jgi:hypothetical protein